MPKRQYVSQKYAKYNKRTNTMPKKLLEHNFKFHKKRRKTEKTRDNERKNEIKRGKRG